MVYNGYRFNYSEGTMKDLQIRRVYTHKGISIVVDIDLIKKTISLVDRDFKPFKWIFADRELEYMEGWIRILDAMKYAIEQSKKELEQAEARDQDEFIELMVSLNNPVLSKPDKI